MRNVDWTMWRGGLASPLRLLPRAVAALIALLLLTGCAGFGPGGLRAGREETPWEVYRESLDDEGLARTSAGRAWLEAAQRRVATAPGITLPYREVVQFDPRRPGAAAWQIPLEERQKLRVRISGPADESARLFVDMLRRDGGEWQPVAGTEARSELLFRAGEGGIYALRVQPELDTGGRWEVTVEAGPVLVFPVQGLDAAAVTGRLGDPRDGGRRAHEGVDIPAPRGTPVLAVADARVLRAGRRGRGGKVVWLEADDGLQFYYAHLSRRRVRAGERLRAGEVIGRVGSSGNAKRRLPHLHFGVYRDGPIDPLPLLRGPGEKPAQVTAELSLLGGWARVRTERAWLHAGPSEETTVAGRVARHQAVYVEGASVGWYRVRTATGSAYLHSHYVEDVDFPIRRLTVTSARALLRAPRRAAAIVGEVEHGADLEVLAENGRYLLVRRAGGKRPAWIHAFGAR